MVALVEYEPLADELRLCGGDGTLESPSEARLLSTSGTAEDETPAFNSDGVSDMRYRAEPSLCLGAFFSLGVVEALEWPASDVLFRGDADGAKVADVGDCGGCGN